MAKPLELMSGFLIGMRRGMRDMSSEFLYPIPYGTPGDFRDFQAKTPIFRDNFVALNIFYKELTYSHFIQNQGSNLVVLLSNIGGNMGMFVGMSLLSCTEVIIYLSKLTWILFSKKRRDYLKKKKDDEKAKERKLDETLRNIKTEAEKAAEVGYRDPRV